MGRGGWRVGEVGGGGVGERKGEIKLEVHSNKKKRSQGKSGGSEWNAALGHTGRGQTCRWGNGRDNGQTMNIVRARGKEPASLF